MSAAKEKNKPERAKKFEKSKATIVECSEVYETYEYNVFTLDVRNRPISGDKVNQFVKDFKGGKNFMKEFPGIVDDNFIILDGQHRFMACRNLGLPFYFRVADKLTIDNVADVQLNAGWSTMDYIHAFVNQKNPDYIIVHRFIKKYKMPPTTTVMLLSGKYEDSGSGLRKTGFYEGLFKVRSEDWAHKVAEAAGEFGRLGFRTPYNRGFISALSKVMKTEGYSEVQMYEQMKSYGANLLRPQINTELYIRNLEELYNYKRSEKNRLRFL